MHDPMTLAFDIKYPFKKKGAMYRNSFIQIWHVDPEKDGTDDSCGWFLRSRHLDKKILERIISDFEVEWDRTFCPYEVDKEIGFCDESDFSNDKKVYSCGWFHPNGDPYKSVIGITVGMFWYASYNCLGHSKAEKYMRDHLWEIIHFAENNIDSLHDGIVRKFEKGCNEEYTKDKRKERIESMAGCIYAYIMRDVRPWYKHPRWHIHHWKIKVMPLMKIKRFLFDRCCVCKKRFRLNEIPMGNWDGDRIWHSGCDSKNYIKES